MVEQGKEMEQNGNPLPEISVPDFEECERLWKKYRTPDRVINHCKAVSHTAALIAESLNHCGYMLNVPLIRAAGWLHDITRVEEEHWIKGAEIACEHGYPEVGEIIRVHMLYRIDPDKKEITETDLVCLADRLVKEDQFVGLAERMDYVIEKSRQYPGAEDRIRKSFALMGIFLEHIESIVGKPVQDLMK